MSEELKNEVEAQEVPVVETVNPEQFLADFDWHKYEEGIEAVDEAKLKEFETALETSELAKKFSRTLHKGDVVYFHGEIGVGKTTFIRHLINNLQQLNKINLTEVTSPTFNLVNEYDVGNFIIQHYDLYRLTDYSEIKNIGLFENKEEIVTLINNCIKI